MQTANDIRSTFLGFFEKNGHEVVPSSPLVPRNDPTLMFTNAGMVQFKNVFTGVEKRDYVRATTAQKCVRAGGKHNDLDNVGYTARHHTFFEMLGNFSFGDYFKERAIELAWTLITREFGIPAERLLVTVYHDDDEAFGHWKKIAGLPDSRIIRIPTSDNFWAMGDTGPCGPCSEIFYDHGEKIAGGPPGSADQDGDRFIEIWNLVFMQYEQVDKETRLALPKPSIDTGMGLERLAALLQGKHDNYDVDLLRSLIEASADASNTDPDGPFRVSHRVVADHLRSSAFLIADGVLPSNEGRGYVLRRIMRRAMRHAQMMGCRDPLLWRLVPALVRQMGPAYPELERASAAIADTLKTEETRFRATLDKGLKLLEDEISALGGGQKLPGAVAFKLYDTYGFPLDLTQDALKGRGIAVDTDGFDAEMKAQRQRAKAAWAGSGEAATEGAWFDLKERLGASEFLGYDTTEAEGRILAFVDAANAEPAEVTEGLEVAVIVNQTPFYGESGGQVGDTGLIETATGRLRVTDTQKKLGDLIIHRGVVESGRLAVGSDARLVVDAERRDATRAHHSATHLLHAALRQTLGEHVTQKGSQVGPDRLRFDFAHNQALDLAELRAVEAQVNRQIRANAGVATKVMGQEEAIKAGAMALFGEKYGDEVRVVTMGGGEAATFSVELCGGTHVRRTGDIGGFKIVGESAVAAGIRRVEAVTGAAFLAWAQAEEDLLHRAAETLRIAPADLPARIAQVLDDRRKLERELAEARKQLATGGGQGAATRTIAGITYAGRVLDGVPAKDLKGMADEIKKQIGSGVVALAATADGKASLVVAVTADLTAKFSAVDLVRVGSEALGGKGGGGRPDMAQAGGPDAAKAEAAVEAIAAALEK
ncbi:alanine--tRNA ligase [Phaeospirillum tilakii]|uniref:Alanine--tRNA ligase n=1 Tax=Phaeospirillum tilakii TaxID=741673 RepID=A0ABW5C7N0_9PROT